MSGEHFRCKIVITEDKEFKNFIDKMIANANVGILVGTHSWRQQFVEALTVEDIDGGMLCNIFPVNSIGTWQMVR